LNAKVIPLPHPTPPKKKKKKKKNNTLTPFERTHGSHNLRERFFLLAMSGDPLRKESS
jgi:hypothetical protein